MLLGQEIGSVREPFNMDDPDVDFIGLELQKWGGGAMGLYGGQKSCERQGIQESFHRKESIVTNDT
jgi:hypothetical protein